MFAGIPGERRTTTCQRDTLYERSQLPLAASKNSYLAVVARTMSWVQLSVAR
jgi:hypothetical protein